MFAIDVNFMFVVAIAVIAAQAFSAFWFSPKIFGDKWMKLANVKPSSGKDCGKMMLITFFAYFAIALTLFTIIIWAGATTAKAGLLIGLWIGCGITGMSLLVPYLWENRPIKLFMISAGNLILSVVLMGALMAHLIGIFFITPPA